MKPKGGGWKRQSWQDAASEIGQALEPSAQSGEELRQIADDQIDDSPYQARAGYDDAQIADLAQGMAESGFQGALFVRPHPAGPQGGRERYQLAYGHRRRRAWRAVCAGRGQPCILSAVVRPFSDQQMLTIGAQENLQRQDLNPMEEARLVLWHQELYYPAGLAEIGRMLGKSEHWAKARSRLGQLPETLQAVVWRSPALMTGVLEISRLWDRAPDRALQIAEQAEREGLNQRQLRQLVTEAEEQLADSEISNNRCVNTPIVNEDTISALGAPPPDPGAQIEVEVERILARLHGWQRMAGNAAAQAVIERSCERILLKIQTIISKIGDS